MVPVQIETYVLDPEAENPQFVLDHELTELYSLPDLRPSNIAKLSYSFLHDSDLSMTYFNTKVQNGLGLISECEHECVLEAHCETKSSTWVDEQICRGLKTFNWSSDAGKLLTYFMEPWYEYHRIPIDEEQMMAFKTMYLLDDEEFED